MDVNTLTNQLQKNVDELKKRLPSEDILTYSFSMADDTAGAIIYADGIVNKQLLGDLVARPLSRLSMPKRRKAPIRVAMNQKIF